MVVTIRQSDEKFSTSCQNALRYKVLPSLFYITCMTGPFKVDSSDVEFQERL